MKIRERSLATLLSKLDRDQDLTWLGDRPDVQAVLARLLQCSVRELARAPSAEPGASARKVRWADLPYARSFDLTEERLPPTVPAEVADPARWDRTFWLAPSGAGRSLTGQWLAARGLAHFRSVERLDDVTPAEDAPLFVELTSNRATVGRAPSLRRLCVAGAVAPPAGTGWRVVTSPSIGACLPELVRWLLERFPPDTALDEASLVEWLSSGPLPKGEADGFGAVLGLAGVLDRIGLGRARGKSVLELARLDSRRRFDEAFGPDAREVAWQRRNAVDVMVAMARRALTDDTVPFDSPRTLEEWTALVPDEHKSGLDVEWLRVSLSRVDSSIRPGDVERAARKLSPGAFRIVRALSGAGLLGATADDRLRPGPRWLCRAVELEAERQLSLSSPFEWGEALLRPHAAPRIAERLFDSLRAGESGVLSDVVELEAGESPAYAVAVETAFRCAGLSLCAGAELDAGELGDVWDAAAELWLTLGDSPPVPRVEHPPELGPLLQRGAFYLAALAIAEARGASWPSGGAARVYDAIADVLAHGKGAPWFDGAHALIDRRRRSQGSVGHALEAPGLLLDRVGSAELEWDGALAAADPDVLRALWRSRGSSELAPLATALYRAWERAGFPDVEGTVLAPSTDAGRSFFAHAPAELALRVLADGADRAALVSLLGDEAWRLISETPPEDPELLAALAEQLPEAWVERWLARPALGLHVKRRHPAAARERVLADARAGDVERVIAARPEEELEPVLEALADCEAKGRLASPARDALRGWLHSVVRERAPGWRAAYSLLARLEG